MGSLRVGRDRLAVAVALDALLPVVGGRVVLPGPKRVSKQAGYTTARPRRGTGL